MPWTYAFSNLNGEEIVGTFYEKEIVKWKGCHNYFNSWIDKKE